MESKWNLNSFAWTNEEKLPGFGRLLGSWLDVHRSFCEGAQPHYSWEWGHNERSQIGLLANAAILIGGLSIEESSIEKDFEPGKKKPGRSDLWLRLSPPTAHNDYLIEAKMEQYLNIDLGDTRQKIAEGMEAARENTRCLKGNPGKFVAMAFLSLRFAHEELDSLGQRTSELISQIWTQSQSKKDIDAIGAIWMGEKDFQRSKLEREKKYPGWKNVHFGMVLLASRIEI